MARLIIRDDRYIYIDGYRQILEYTPEKVLLECNNKKIKIIGDNLIIKCYQTTEMCICGKLSNINFIK